MQPIVLYKKQKQNRNRKATNKKQKKILISMDNQSIEQKKQKKTKESLARDINSTNYHKQSFNSRDSKWLQKKNPSQMKINYNKLPE